jgi:hypothetical protein
MPTAPTSRIDNNSFSNSFPYDLKFINQTFINLRSVEIAVTALASELSGGEVSRYVAHVIFFRYHLRIDYAQSYRHIHEYERDYFKHNDTYIFLDDPSWRNSMAVHNAHQPIPRIFRTHRYQART